SLVGSGPVFMLRVRGDSMVDAGILDGDLVAVRRQPDANDGDIVAAMIEGEEATVKRLYRRDGQIVLHAENPAYPDMVVEGEVAVLGQVVSVLRRLRRVRAIGPRRHSRPGQRGRRLPGGRRPVPLPRARRQ